MVCVDGKMDKLYKHRILCTTKYEFEYTTNINGVPAEISTDNYVDIYYYINYADYTNDKTILQ